MDLKQLTAHMNRLVATQGWYAAASPRPQTPRNLAASLSIEAAEVLEHFQWGDQPADRSELAAELADVLLYLLQLSAVCEIDLEQAALDKLQVNHGRHWD